MKVVDLGSQLSALFEQEEMLAFFDLRLRVPGRPPIDALGRLSKPKRSAAGHSYLSMFLLVDTPDADLRADVESYFRAVPWGRWRDLFDGIYEVVAMPPMHASDDLYVAAVDIVTKSDVVTDQLGGQRLIASLGDILPGEVGEITSWGDQESEAPPKSRWRSLAERLRGRD